MSGSEARIEKILARWSRRQRLAARHAGTDDGVPVDTVETAISDPAQAAFDPTSLPPIEAINAASDLRAFLAPGVPIELTRAALRRAWVADPVIRDFIEIAENQWDFGTPDGVPGFGSLTMTPQHRRLVAELFGDPGALGPADEAEQKAHLPMACAGPAAPVTTASSDAQPLALIEVAPDRPIARKHDGARPS